MDSAILIYCLKFLGGHKNSSAFQKLIYRSLSECPNPGSLNKSKKAEI